MKSKNLKKKPYQVYLTVNYVEKIRFIFEQLPDSSLNLSNFFDSVLRETIDSYESGGKPSVLFEKKVKDLTISDLKEVLETLMKNDDAEE